MNNMFFKNFKQKTTLVFLGGSFLRADQNDQVVIVGDGLTVNQSLNPVVSEISCAQTLYYRNIKDLKSSNLSLKTKQFASIFFLCVIARIGAFVCELYSDIKKKEESLGHWFGTFFQRPESLEFKSGFAYAGYFLFNCLAFFLLLRINFIGNIFGTLLIFLFVLAPLIYKVCWRNNFEITKNFILLSPNLVVSLIFLGSLFYINLQYGFSFLFVLKTIGSIGCVLESTLIFKQTQRA